MPAPVAGDDGPAFGSLANLGGPRKFKKKPVLVLDPEELEKAHMMFQEASAEMLGEQVERPGRPKAVLGLAPIDDDDAAPEDMGESDDAEAGDDNDSIPSAEEVLRMTEARERADREFDPALQASEDDFIAQQLENLDVDHRIFPSLPLRSEEELAAEEEAERAAKELRTDLEKQSDRAELPRASIEIAYDPGAHDKRETHSKATFPVDPLPGPEPKGLDAAAFEPQRVEKTDPEFEPAPAYPAPLAKPASVFGDEPFLEFPSQALIFSDEAAGRPSQHADIDPHHDSGAESPVFLEGTIDDDWEEDAPLGLKPDLENTAVPDEPIAQKEVSANYTEIEDESVDGYAFMYAHNPRGRTLQALADGESNSLRAKLIQERAADAAEDEGEEKPSILSRFVAWLRGLFG